MIIDGAESFLLRGESNHGVLLIHGLTGLPAELYLLGKFLNDRGYTVLGVRLSGHGTTPEDLSRQTAEDFIDSARDGKNLLRGLVKNVSIVGHSMGALIAFLLASEDEKFVTRVISLAAPIFVSKFLHIENLPPREKCFIDGVPIFYPKLHRHLQNVPLAANKTYRKIPLVTVHELFALTARVKECLKKIRQPVLIIHGMKDHTAALTSVEFIYKNVLSIEKKVFLCENASHSLPLGIERERIFVEIADFLTN